MSLTDRFKECLGSWASGVSVVTTRHDGLLYGLTVSSFSSVSLDPPLVSVCISNGNRAAGMIEDSGWFAVSVLSSQQEEASNYFARPGRLPTAGFVEIDGAWTLSGLPIVKDAVGWCVCDVSQAVPAGDHTVFIGAVREAGADEDREPLLYWRRGYRRLLLP
ncbi:MAG: flavin reductase family protein [Deltaproteobacteria bacterium]|nr:flavin reductase family protein [Deltaproteobacteria bacterium]